MKLQLTANAICYTITTILQYNPYLSLTANAICYTITTMLPISSLPVFDCQRYLLYNNYNTTNIILTCL